MFRFEADGFSDSIWILWDANLFDHRVILAHKKFVHPMLAPDMEEECVLKVTYASPKLPLRAALSSEERLPMGRPSACFREWVSKKGLIDWGSMVHALHGVMEMLSNRGDLLDLKKPSQMGTSRVDTLMRASLISSMLLQITAHFCSVLSQSRQHHLGRDRSLLKQHNLRTMDSWNLLRSVGGRAYHYRMQSRSSLASSGGGIRKYLEISRRGMNG